MRTPIARLARKIAVTVVGTVMLTVGIAMIVLPGPASLVIPAALAVLGTEFPWARRLLDRLRATVLLARQRLAASMATWRGASGRSLATVDRLPA